MSVKQLWTRFRERTDPDRARAAAQRDGKSPDEVSEDVRKASRRKKLLKSGAAGGGSFGG